MKKLLKTASLLTILVTALTATQAFPISYKDARQYLIATRHAVCGPAKKGIKLRAGGKMHQFNVKRATYVPSVDGNTLWVSGQISHHLSHRLDDQVYYNMIYKNGGDGLWKLKDIKTKIDRGGWNVFLRPLLDIVKAIAAVVTGKPMPVTPETIIQNTSDLAALVGGNWEDSVNILVGNIAAASSNPDFCSM